MYRPLTLEVLVLLHHLVSFTLKAIKFLSHAPQELPIPLDFFDHMLQLILRAPQMFELHYVVAKPLDPSKSILYLIFNRNCLFFGSLVPPNSTLLIGGRVACISLSQLFLVFIFFFLRGRR